jgi:hypothetical protein
MGLLLLFCFVVELLGLTASQVLLAAHRLGITSHVGLKRSEAL